MSAVAVVDRYSTRAVHLDGASVGPRELVRVSLLAADRDPRVFPAPDAVNLHRTNSRSQLAFAPGPHVCIAVDTS